MKRFPLVNIIIVNYNQYKMTIECIHSILKSNYNNFRIIVVDNGSSPENIENIQDEFGDRVTLLRSAINKGYVGGINWGLEKAEKSNPEYFLIMNNDAVIDKFAIKELVKTAERHNNDCIVTGKVYHYDKPSTIQYVGENYTDKLMLKGYNICQDEIDIGQCDKEEERDMIDDIFWLLPAKVYYSVGKYNPYFFMYAEQADYALRAKAKGFKLMYSPNAKLWHKGSLSTGRSTYNPKMNFWATKGVMIYYYLHLSKRAFLKFYFKQLKVIIGANIRNIVKSIYNKDNMFMNSFAKLTGFIFFTMWLFNKKEDKGYNPF